MVIIALIILVVISIYLIIKNKKMLNEYKLLQDEINYLQSLHDNLNRYSNEKQLNRERINNTKILFDINTLDEKLVIKDELDYQYKSIMVYVSKGAIDIPMTDRLEKIARIELDCESDTVVKIEKLYVHKDYRRNNIASLLIQRVMEWAQLRNISEIYLTAASSFLDISQINLVNFYIKNGFEVDHANIMRAKIN